MKYTYEDYGCKNKQEFKETLHFMREYTYQTFRDAGSLRLRAMIEAEKSAWNYKRKYPEFLRNEIK